MIHIANSDSVIWHKDQIIMTIAEQMANKVPLINLHTNGEGPCARALGLYELLDNLCLTFNYPKNQIYLTTCNLLEYHDVYNIRINPQVLYLDTAKQYAEHLNVKKKFNSEMKTFAHFIGHGNLYRLKIASHLFTNYKSLTCQTYHCKITDTYHSPFIGVEDMMRQHYSWNEIDQAMAFLKHTPITLDKIDSYPILRPATFNITKFYPNFFVEIVSLTYFSGNTFYIDEKIWRPILMGTPFIVQGPSNFLKNLKKLGFKTFDQWWDEGYGEDPPDYQVTAILEIVDQIAKFSTTELASLYEEMKPVLDHNLEVLKQLNTQSFLNKDYTS